MLSIARSSAPVRVRLRSMRAATFSAMLLRGLRRLNVIFFIVAS
jgi:hypothetical protein